MDFIMGWIDLNGGVTARWLVIPQLERYFYTQTLLSCTPVATENHSMTTFSDVAASLQPEEFRDDA